LSQSNKANSQSHKTVVGKYVIDDFCRERGNRTKSQFSIEIQVDGRSKSVEVRDNGTGIPAEKAQRILHDLGRSEKDRLYNRGFRGIGRLGGLGYCEQLRFTTKAEGENVVSTSSWDCLSLKQLINEKSNCLDASHIVEHITKFQQETYAGPNDDHFFVVQMNNVQSSRNVLLNVPAIKAYLSQSLEKMFHRMKRTLFL